MKNNWAALVGAFREPLEWSLDRAASFARHYPDDVAIIERVRAHIRARIDNKQFPLDVDDLVFAFTLVMGALDFELCHLGAYEATVETEIITIPHATEQVAA